MSNIAIGTINLWELSKKVRRSFPQQTEKAHSSPKGKHGYDRRREKRDWQKEEK